MTAQTLTNVTFSTPIEMASHLRKLGYRPGAVFSTWIKDDCRRVVIVEQKDGRFGWANI